MSAECPNVKHGDTSPASPPTHDQAKHKKNRWAVPKLLKTIKQSRKLLTSHWNNRSRWWRISPRRGKPGKQTPSEDASSIQVDREGVQPTTTVPPTEVAQEPSSHRSQSLISGNGVPPRTSEPSPTPSSPTEPSRIRGWSHGPLVDTALQDRDDSDLAPPNPPFAPSSDKRHSDSSISLSSQRSPSSVNPGASGSQQSHTVIGQIDHLFYQGNRSSTHFSTASTLKNSDYVHDDLSRRPSEVQPTSRAEEAGQVGMAEAGPPSTPPLPTITTMATAEDPVPAVTRPPQSGRLHSIQTDLHPSYRQHGSDGEDSHSTIRGRSSSATSPGDLSAIGGAFG